MYLYASQGIVECSSPGCNVSSHLLKMERVTFSFLHMASLGLNLKGWRDFRSCAMLHECGKKHSRQGRSLSFLFQFHAVNHEEGNSWHLKCFLGLWLLTPVAGNPFWGAWSNDPFWRILSQIHIIRHPAYQTFTLQLITVTRHHNMRNCNKELLDY